MGEPELSLSLLFQAIQVLLPAQEHLLAGNGGAGADRFAKMIERQGAGNFAATDDDRRPVEIADVDSAMGGDGGGINIRDAIQSE